MTTPISQGQMTSLETDGFPGQFPQVLPAQGLNKYFRVHMNEELIMKRCLELASRGLGRVSPNPMVGAVLVQDGQIIGEGYHELFGAPHAEVNAIENALRRHSLRDLKDSTLFVNLEQIGRAHV